MPISIMVFLNLFLIFRLIYMAASYIKNKDINLNVSKPEFVSFCWIKPEKFNLMWVPDFKRKVYTEVFRDFYDLDIT